MYIYLRTYSTQNDHNYQFYALLACISTQCPRGSVCNVCNETRRAYCEYTCAVNNGGCDEGSRCIEVDIPTCSPGQCCSPVNTTCQSMLITYDGLFYIYFCIKINM